jgi:phosphate transport system protein
MRKAFHEQIDEITEDVISMSNLTKNALYNAVNTLINNDAALAQEVIEGDDIINNYEISIEKKCVILQAEYQPVAIDLRYIHSISNIIIHLERIGDLSANIAKIAKSLYKLNMQYLDEDIKKSLIEMLNLVKQVLNKAITAFKKKDFKLASKIGKIDDAVDDIQKTIVQKLYSSTFNKEENIKIIADISLVIRYLERIGDHSVSIGERVQYFLTGDYRVFHSDN